MEDFARAAVWGGFLADALSLGAHWIYDTDRIDRDIGRVEGLMAPPTGSFHPTKGKGDFTHYGDQMLVLLRSAAESGGFRLERFFAAWTALFGGYQGYVDHATRATLEAVAAGKGPDACGSSSTDLSGASRFAALAYHCRADVDAFVRGARSQTAMTHADPKVVDAAEFLARVTHAVFQGASPLEAVQSVHRSHFSREPFDRWVDRGLGSLETDTRSAIAGFGQMCDIDAGFPGVLHLIGKYADRYDAAMIENVMAGGDSAARGIAAGAVIAAHAGMNALPKAWRRDLKAADTLADCLSR